MGVEHLKNGSFVVFQKLWDSKVEKSAFFSFFSIFVDCNIDLFCENKCHKQYVFEYFVTIQM